MKHTSLIFVVIMMLLAACGRDEKESVREDAYPATNAEPKVTVSRFADFGSINKKVYGTFNDSQTITAFEEAIATAEPIPGLLDVAFADYDVVIERAGVPNAIHLWIDRTASEDTYGMFMYANNTGTGYNLTKEATTKLYGLIHGIEYTSEAAAQNGDVVIGLSGTKNAVKWTQFVANVEAKKPDDVQVIQFTIEGDPIFYDLTYDGNAIRYQLDTTHDAFGSPRKLIDYCGEVSATSTDEGKEYRLKACGANKDETNDTFSIRI